MKTIAMIVRKPPYGDINAAEAVRHAMGAASDEIGVNLILLDGGVFLARKGQQDTDGFMNLENAIGDAVELGVNVYADSESLAKRHVAPDCVASGVKITGWPEIAALIGQAGQTMIF
ncbi:MAG: DsrE family protein [Nitrospirae bacterium]|nr:DsrE family protein [Nitrospirota bacterium]